MSQFDAAVCLTRDVGIVRDHQNGVTGIVQLVKNVEDDGFVGFVEVSGGLVGKNKFWLIDQRARNGHALLFSARKLCGKMREPVAKPDAVQCVVGLRFIGNAVEVLREHHVFQRGKIRHEMELLEHKSDFFRAITDQLVFAALGEIDIVDDDAAGSERVEAAKNIDQSGFAGAGGAHERDPFAGVHVES